MKAASINKENLDKEYAACKKAYRGVFCLYYALVVVLFFFLCKQVVESHSLKPASLFILLKELGAMAGIWYLFYLCDTRGGLLKLLKLWEKSILSRLNEEEAIEALRTGGIYFVGDTEMTLVDDKYLVPRDRVK